MCFFVTSGEAAITDDEGLSEGMQETHRYIHQSTTLNNVMETKDIQSSGIWRNTDWYLTLVKLIKSKFYFEFTRALYVVGSKSFRLDIQKPRQMENAVRDI